MILRLLLDGSFFLAVFNPLITGKNPVMRWGLLAILAVWLVWIVLNWKKRDLEGRIHDMALIEVKILAVIQICSLVLLGFKGWQEKCAPFVALFAVAAILFLRAGRLVGGSQEKMKFWGANGIEFVLILGVAAVFSSNFVKAAVWKLLGGVYMKLVFPILMVFLNLFQMFLMVVGPFIASFFSKVEFAENGIDVDNRTGQDFLQLTGNEPLVETPMWAKIAGVVLVAMALGALLYFMYRKLSGAGSGRDRRIRGEVKKSTIGDKDKKAVQKHSLFEEKNVRYYYRKFLGHCKKHHLWPESSMVTSEIMRMIIVETLGEEEDVDQLTCLYRDVRYGGKNDGEEERKLAKEWMKRIRSQVEKTLESRKS